MFIKEIISIDNYRNLSGLTLLFDEEINFIVGENNIGKTNSIELMYKMIKIGKFDENDFTDIKEPIKINFKIKYSSDELGYFENIFDIDNEYVITITAQQDNTDTRIEYSHTASNNYIKPQTIKMLNFIYYSSLRVPNKELNFSNNIGTGKVLNYIMKKSLESKDIEQLDLLKKHEINDVLVEVNSKFEKLNGLSSEKIEAFLSDDKQNIINRLLEIGDTNGRNITKLGDGVQYSFNIFLNILELLVNLKTTKKEDDFESLLVKDEMSKKYMPIILGLDEPEIHQHPYRQRALIKSIRKIIDNKNKHFVQIIKDLFDIDGFTGQIFISTHSPSIILDDYKQITRIYKCKNSIRASSGNLLKFNDHIYKHLKKSFIYFKEAMFAKSVILVEGDTEYGAVPVFAKRLGVDLDKENIGIVKLDGAKSVLNYLKLFDAFQIDAIAILDKDQEEKYKDNPKIKFTTALDFEKEVFDGYSFNQYVKYLESINSHSFLMNILKKKLDNFDINKFGRNPVEYEIPEEIGKEVMEEIRDGEIERLGNVKNAVNGALIAEFVDEVPKSFEYVIYLVDIL